jgi:exopolyphosphatase/guanosine-5'-triphosphate,3'-diphosphate pyrophosphatase
MRPTELVSVVDIGSNTVRMVVYDLAHKKRKPVFNERVFCRLGIDLATTGRLGEDSVTKALLTLRGFSLLAKAMGVDAVHAVATAAVRDAVDGPDFIRQAEAATGWRLRVLSGDEEATYAALGVIGAFADADGLIADLGGGSLELARVTGGVVACRASLPIGVLRLRAAVDPRQAIEQAFESVDGDGFGQPRTLYMIGGTWRDLAKAFAKHEKIRHETHGMTLKAIKFAEYLGHLQHYHPQTLEHMLNISHERALDAREAALVLMALVERFGVRSVIVSTAGLRDGLIGEIAARRASK